MAVYLAITPQQQFKGIKIMKLHHTKYKKNYHNYILDHIDQDYEGNQLTTDQEKIKFLFHRFYKEKSYDIARRNKRNVMIEWLQGLAIPFACYNGEIIDLAIEMGSIDDDPSIELIHRVLDNYFPFMANIILGMEKHIESEGV